MQSQIRRPSGLAQSMRRSARIAWRAMWSPTLAREAQVGRARDEAFLARRQRHVRILGRDYLVHGQQDLAMAADGEPFRRGDSEFLDRILLW